MKRILLLPFVVTFCYTVNAQDTLLWPIAGSEAGKDIIHSPQSYIDNELNLEYLFIAAPEGSKVVAPANGTITHISIGYKQSLSSSTGYRLDAGKSFDEGLVEVRKEIASSVDPKYLSGTLSISTDDGYRIYINGLTGEEIFKTGQRVTRGEVLGKVGYSYYKIKEPSISVSMSKNSGTQDPMTPFGIPSTFVPPAEIKPVVSITKEQAREDFIIYIDALKETFPGLYKVISPEELEQYTAKILADIDSFEGDIGIISFWRIMRRVIARIHDSHLGILPPQGGLPRSPTQTQTQSGIWFGFIDDTLICTNAIEKYGHLVGREIISVNGIPADSIRAIILETTDSYDAQVESYKEYRLATTGFSSILQEPYGNGNDFVVEFADGENTFTEEFAPEEFMLPLVNDIISFWRINWYRGASYEMKMLDDSTAYIGLRTFGLNQVQVEEIGSFIDSVSHVPNLIIDVRNNGGGHDEVLVKLYSYIAGKPTVLNGYSRVNKTGDIKAFDHSLNYYGIKEVFPEYVKEEGLDGFVLRQESIIMPDSLINYKGRVYVLANENSQSAATLFPAMLVRNHRGLVVGRETRSAYHFMNALKFMQLRLPNSTIVMVIPLVELVFDTAVNDRVPYGRGVIPDHNIELTLDELGFKNGDAILNYTLQLIENGVYMDGDDPFDVPEQEKRCNYTFILICAGILLVGIIAVVSVRRRSCKRKKEYDKAA